eukprot:m.186794 g.186794  ORF g.186794 m.186794 type:complete len:115 (+) comp16875_c0_seq1:40-384(+)
MSAAWSKNDVAAVLGATGVAMGAFGAHALKDTLASRGTTEAWKTAVLYHLVHSVALIALPPSAGEWTATLWTAGIALFSGSIYGLALGGPRMLGPITPIGGMCFIFGWLSIMRR